MRSTILVGYKKYEILETSILIGDETFYKNKRFILETVNIGDDRYRGGIKVVSEEGLYVILWSRLNQWYYYHKIKLIDKDENR